MTFTSQQNKARNTLETNKKIAFYYSLFIKVMSDVLQCSIYDWVLDHRFHHKHFGTDLDPYNNKNGLLNAHVISHLKKWNPDVQRLAAIDMSDIEADSVVMFQKR